MNSSSLLKSFFKSENRIISCKNLNRSSRPARSEMQAGCKMAAVIFEYLFRYIKIFYFPNHFCIAADSIAAVNPLRGKYRVPLQCSQNYGFAGADASYQRRSGRHPTSSEIPEDGLQQARARLRPVSPRSAPYRTPSHGYQIRPHSSRRRDPRPNPRVILSRESDSRWRGVHEQLYIGPLFRP